MRIKVLGSGGSIPLPKPMCNCDICTEARIKGDRFKRYGCSIYIHDINSLFDTPEDIMHSLNASNIKRVDNLFYSHLDPDHTMGIRVLESLRKNWLDVSPELNGLPPINLYSLPAVLTDLKKMQNGYGKFIDYYEKQKKIIRTCPVYSVNILGCRVQLVPIVTDITSTMFLIDADGIKIVYAPCDVKPLNLEYLLDVDILIIGSVIPTRVIKNNFVIDDNNPLLDSLYTIEEIMKIKHDFNIKKVIITHLEEDWGLSYNDYKNMEKELNDIVFAYDGMDINIGGRKRCLQKI